MQAEDEVARTGRHFGRAGLAAAYAPGASWIVAPLPIRGQGEATVDGQPAAFLRSQHSGNRCRTRVHQAPPFHGAQRRRVARRAPIHGSPAGKWYGGSARCLPPSRAKLQSSWVSGLTKSMTFRWGSIYTETRSLGRPSVRKPCTFRGDRIGASARRLSRIRGVVEEKPAIGGRVHDLRFDLTRAKEFDDYVAARPALAAYLAARTCREEALQLLAPFHLELLPLLPALSPLWTHNDWHASNLMWSDAGVNAAGGGGDRLRTGGSN